MQRSLLASLVGRGRLAASAPRGCVGLSGVTTVLGVHTRVQRPRWVVRGASQCRQVHDAHHRAPPGLQRRPSHGAAQHSRQRFSGHRSGLRRLSRLLGATGAGSVVLLGASWQCPHILNAESIHRVEWTTEQVRDLLDEYQNARTLQNYCAALGIVGLGLLDFAMLTSTGVFGLLIGAGGVVAYIYDNLRAVNGDQSGRLRFIDVSAPHEELLGLLEYHNVKSEATLMPESSPEHQMVARVGRRIAAATLLNDDDGGDSSRKVQWEFHCEDRDEVNAFVLPGGKTQNPPPQNTLTRPLV